MPPTDIGQADYSDLSTQVVDYSVAKETTDSAQEGKETTYMNYNFTQYLGYYKKIPELKAAIDAIAKWTVGKGFQAEDRVKSILNTVRGWGADTFDTILKNMVIVKQINGDSYAEIIRDTKTGVIINIKPLSPQNMQIVVDEKGRIKRYEQINKHKKAQQTFQPQEIFHLTNNRVADEIHGVSIIESVEEIILMRNEALTDWRRVLHRNVDPVWIFHLDTDDTSEIASFKSKMDKARGKGENMYIPKDCVVPEQVATSANATLNPLPWIEYLSSFFFQAVGIPQIILGGSQEFTEATAKIAYLSFQQAVEDQQRDIEMQIWSQLGLKINLIFPASLENELLSDQNKDETNGATQPNDTIAGRGL